MDSRVLGKNGPKVSVVGLGCNNFGGRLDLDATRKVVHKALDLGITLFDTADVYGGYGYGNYGGSEEQLGQIFGARRKDIVLATKFGMAMNAAGTMKGAAPGYIRSAAEASLKRLRTDWIDLYQIHRPDPQTPIEDTLGALDALVKEGKVRAIGCSCFSSAQIDAAQAAAARLGLTPLATSQDEYSLLTRDIERDPMPAIRRHGLGLVPYYPLASGLLTGKYKRNAPPPAGARLAGAGMGGRYLSDANWAIVEQLERFCAERGKTLLQLAFGWLLAHDEVPSVIAGATKPEQIEQNVAAASWTLSREEKDAVDRLTRRG
ncbi:MAG TPA: aldo/keto reductase [Stellaceae bacterium]|nr:aldo/keto reductase [Stellaceae bacterium]